MVHLTVLANAPHIHATIQNALIWIKMTFAILLVDKSARDEDADLLRYFHHYCYSIRSMSMYEELKIAEIIVFPLK